MNRLQNQTQHHQMYQNHRFQEDNLTIPIFIRYGDFLFEG
jgi:hypothetical protein